MEKKGNNGKCKLGEGHEEEGDGREVNQEKSMKRKVMLEKRIKIKTWRGG